MIMLEAEMSYFSRRLAMKNAELQRFPGEIPSLRWFYSLLFVFLLSMFVIFNVSFAADSTTADKDKLKAETLPPCQACKQLIDSFNKGMDRTARFKFDGGDADWEEKKQRKYAESEVRLTEVQEDLCKDVIRGQIQCHQLASDNEEQFEQWWLHLQTDKPDLYEWFCIETTKVCCPNNTFGANCDPCPGGIDNPCSGNGRCRGSGTRKGLGECRCIKGYSGVACDQCSSGFYASSKADNRTIVCSACHKSCKGGCKDGTQDTCEECWDGWHKHPQLGCQDIDECYAMESPCAKREFCANTEGSYQCIECHQSCASCNGDGPDECIDCNDGFTRHDNLCIDSATWWRTVQTNWGRYLTYFGLCLATCIILKKSTVIAAVVGLAVAAYIGVSEYVITHNDSSSPGVRFFPVTNA